ncbi:hypothetical protein RB620_06475 [Paenibacillus sp. LHD-117]|uniref:hypothetical protein n=1 Tax=Paenibacillus sp. LHD-117 TaxID=3071412 RepID=UPI0027DF1883|nr:hypothetical protein [Paenibacillus sp. LHD-117]MDQ6419081.1 hypothetical protein [Paenibacillus sp. LHD-117]
MIRLLKYDWKRNSNTLIAATVILVLAQAVVTMIGELQHWKPLTAYILSTVIYGFAGFLSFLMVCQTYNANLKAYSRRLLPLPSLYAVASPILLLLACSAFIFLLFLLHEYVYVTWFGLDETIMSALREQITAPAAFAVSIGVAWITIVSAVYVFFCITFAKTFEGKAGTWLGIAAFIVLMFVITWLDSLIVPSSLSGDIPLGITGVSMTDGSDDNLALRMTGFQGIGLVSFLMEVGVVVAQLYGIRYMINRKIKL